MSRRPGKYADLVFVVAPHCPRCKSMDLYTVRSVGDQGDGSILRLSLCLKCGKRFSLILEPPDYPDSGKDD